MTNSEKFLKAYNEIDKFLIKDGNFDSYKSYTYKLKNSSNRSVRRFKDELIAMGELRNAIVHNPKIGEKAIAEPHDNITERIQYIRDSLIKPETVNKFFFEVVGANEDETATDVLKKMKEYSFSQFPVFNGEKITEVINSNTVARWCASNIDDEGTLLIENLKIKDLLDHVEFKYNFKMVDRTTTIDEVYFLFIDHIKKNNCNLDVVFITHNGKNGEKLLGCVTIDDIAPFFISE